MATYRVVILGMKPGQNPDAALQRLAATFKQPVDRLSALVAGPRTIVKRGANITLAAKLQAAIEASGCDCIVEPEVTQPTTPASQASAQNIAPNGSDASNKMGTASNQSVAKSLPREGMSPTVRYGSVLMIGCGVLAVAAYTFLPRSPSAHESAENVAVSAPNAVTVKVPVIAIPQPTVEVTGNIFIVTKGRENFKLALVEVVAIPEAEMIEHIKSRRAIGLEQAALLRSKLESAKKQAAAASTVAASTRKVADARYEELNLSQKLAAIRGDLDEPKFVASNEADSAAAVKRNQVNKISRDIESLNGPRFYLEKLPAPMSVSKTDADGRFTLQLPPGKYVIAATTSRSVYQSSETYHWLVWVDTASPNRTLMLSNDNLFETKCGDCLRPETVAEQVAMK